MLVGVRDRIVETMEQLGIATPDELEITNAALSSRNAEYIDFLYERLQRRGVLYRDCQRMVHTDRNIFAACMVAHGDGDAMVTGLTRSSFVCLNDIDRVIDPRAGERVIG